MNAAVSCAIVALFAETFVIAVLALGSAEVVAAVVAVGAALAVGAVVIVGVGLDRAALPPHAVMAAIARVMNGRAMSVMALGEHVAPRGA